MKNTPNVIQPMNFVFSTELVINDESQVTPSILQEGMSNWFTIKGAFIFDLNIPEIPVRFIKANMQIVAYVKIDRFLISATKEGPITEIHFTTVRRCEADFNKMADIIKKGEELNYTIYKQE